MNPAAEGLVNDSDAIRGEEEDSGIIFKDAEEDCVGFASAYSTRHHESRAWLSGNYLQQAHFARSPCLFEKLGTHLLRLEAGYIPIY